MKKKMESCLHACLSFSFSFTEKQNDEKTYIQMEDGAGSLISITSMYCRVLASDY